MKISLIWVGFNLCLATYGQVQWSDDFSDNRLDMDPPWYGDTSNFIHTPQQTLRLNDTSAGSSRIFTTSPVGIEARWAGWIHLDFNPSGSNYADISLMLDAGDAGYGLRIGGSTNDYLELYRTNRTQRTVLIRSSVDFLDLPEVILDWEVTRNADYDWELRAQLDSSGWQVIGQATDSTYRTSERFELSAVYTVTRSSLFQWDNISVSGKIWVDSIPPEVLSATWLNRMQVQIGFSESVQFPREVVDHTLRIWQIDSLDPETALLTASQPVSDGQYTFDLSGFRDFWGNRAPGNFSLTLHRPGIYDVLITEVLPRPEPPVDLPPHEFVELTNQTTDSINMIGWNFRANSRSWTFDSVVIAPGATLVVSEHSDTAVYGSLLQISSSPGWLPNTSAELTLRDDWGEQIDLVKYQASWYDPGWKSDGGWTLERDPALPHCWQHGAWSASISPAGGTPGNAFSGGVSSLEMINPIERIAVSEGYVVIEAAVPILIHAAIDEAGDSVGFRVAGTSADSRWWRLAPDDPLTEMETWYMDWTYCDGRPIDSAYIRLAVPQSPQSDQVRITEILPKPHSDGSKFVEIMNRGEVAIDLLQLRWGKTLPDGSADNLKPVCDSSWLLMPGQVIWMAAEHGDVLNRYPESRRRAIARSAEMPSLPEQGDLCIAHASGVVIDAVRWTNDSHHALLPVRDGVSLERIAWSSVESAWQSTPAALGYATPGMFADQGLVQATDVALRYAVFSPNNDGWRDRLDIHFGSELDGWMADIEIRSPLGQLIAEIDRQRLLTGGDIVFWDGETRFGNLAVPGQYMVLVRCWHNDGRQKFWRHGCLLTLP